MLTLILASCGLVLALPLGIVLGLARVSPWRWLRWPVTGFVFVVRGLPLLMVIFWAYFFLPSVTGVKTDQFTTMLIALVVFDAAYLAEIGAPASRDCRADRWKLPGRWAWATAPRCASWCCRRRCAACCPRW